MKKTIYMLAIVMMAASVSQAALMPWFDSFEDGTLTEWTASGSSFWITGTVGSGGNIPDGAKALVGPSGGWGSMERSVGTVSSGSFDVEFYTRVALSRTGNDSTNFEIEDTTGGSLVVFQLRNVDATTAEIELNKSGTTHTITKGDDYVKINFTVDMDSRKVAWSFNDVPVEGGINLENLTGDAGLLELRRYYGDGGFRAEMDAITVAIPEPATLSLVAAFSGAILFIRRKFMV